MKRQIIIYIALLGISYNALGQISPMKSQYYINPYLANAAMAGYTGKTSVYANYSNQWNKIAGSPVMVSFSASTLITSKAAIGFNYISEKAGLIRKSQAMGSYAYKVELSEDRSVRFGVSLSWANNRLDQGDATTNGSIDPALGRFNNQENYLDGNFGVAYVSNKFEAQFSYLNLNQNRGDQLSTVDYSTFYSALSYKIDLDESGLFTVKPLLAYRGIKGFNNLIDVAAEWSMYDLKLYTMYHSNKSFSGGVGFNYDKKFIISGMYSSEPSGLQGITGGKFDLTLGYKF
jgi:type IX secretion system PorP/SprF family membrane protein